ncbi:helix-turn-helix domain-containing protein [Corynebacterium glaucum]|uniref:helix-turn-helix domain-containing protein n=1 Tax=Corynebacterium glaucum TaxID=187491 RepID=UPI0025B4112C|nr:helix-turn-helix transcriptional regulator [Corynebacterium glaucum]WJZ08066.1 Antitoxin HigA [Corynebacterium glaucum]
MKSDDYIRANSVEFEVEEFLDDPEIREAFEDAHVRSEVADRLREARKNGKLSQKDVAAAMGTTQSAISDLERGETDPQLSTMQRYARAVGARIRLVVDAPGSAASVISPYRCVSTSTTTRETSHRACLREFSSSYSDIKVS